MSERVIEDLRLGDAFRGTLIPRADFVHQGAPMWYGWAIMDAFLAGLDAGRAEADKEAWTKGHNSAVEAMQEQLEDAVAEEREACAAMADFDDLPSLAEAIRKRASP